VVVLRNIFAGIITLFICLPGSGALAVENDAKQEAIIFSHPAAGDAAVSTLLTIIDKLAPARTGLPLKSGPKLHGTWESVCSWHAPGLSTDEIARRYSRVHKVVQFKGNVYVGTGGSDPGLGAGRVWKVDGGVCRDVTPWGNYADRVFSMYVDKDELYASACHLNGGSQLWKFDGSNWEKALTFDKPVLCILDIIRFKDSLCVGTQLTTKEQRAVLMCEVEGKWKDVWHAPSNIIYKFGVFQDQLYLGLTYPGALWRTSDLKNWSQVDFPPNFDESVSIVETMSVFDDHLIVGYARDGSKAPLSSTVMAFDGSTWNLVGNQPSEWLVSHNFNASTVFRNTLVVSMGSMFDRMSVWALGENGEWYSIGGRPQGDWGGTALAYEPFTGEWIYDLKPIDGELYATFNGDPGMPALWRFRPSP
jgi:hypothetical protein